VRCSTLVISFERYFSPGPGFEALLWMLFRLSVAPFHLVLGSKLCFGWLFRLSVAPFDVVMGSMQCFGYFFRALLFTLSWVRSSLDGYFV
jgi:hypothetical protein